MVRVNNLTKEEFGKKLLPKKIGSMLFKDELESRFRKLYFDNLHFDLITTLFGLSLILSTIIFTLLYQTIYEIFTNLFYSVVWKFIIIYIIFVVLELIVFYFVLFMYLFVLDSKLKKQEHEIEESLPDFLDDLVSNIKGGLSLEKSLLKSVSKENKVLLAEVSLINQKIMMGSTIFDALNEFANRYDSQILKRTFFLITEGLRFGGNIVKPLERISKNLKQIYGLDNEIRANSGGFGVVIKAIALVVAPLLFALALTLLTFIGNLFSLMMKTNSGIISGTIPQEYTSYLVIFSYAMITLITFFSSLITAELNGEKIYTTVKYVPIYLIIGFILFNVMSKVLLGFFGNII